MKVGFFISTRAQETYDKCCLRFGWDKSLRGNFAQRQLLYAKNATPEKYSVWCLTHHNLNVEYNEDRNWYNYIFRDHIDEVWFINNPEFYDDNTTRVTFIKTKRGYEFFGVFQPVKRETRVIKGKPRQVKTYQKIAGDYPT